MGRNGSNAWRHTATVVLCIGGFWMATAQAELAPEDIRAQIKTVEASTELTESNQQRALALYQAALVDIDAASRDQKSAREYAQALRDAPRQTAAWERKTDALPAPALNVPRDIDKLSQTLASDQAKLSQLQADLANVKTEITQAAEHNLNQILTATHTELGKAGVQPNMDNEDLGMQQALAIAQQARQRALRVRLEKFEQQLLSKDTRLAVMTAHQHYLTSKIDTLDIRVARLQAALNESRQRQAGLVAKRAEALALDLQEHPQWVQKLAAHNAELAGEISGITFRIEQHAKTRKTIGIRQTQIARYQDNLNQQLAIIGANRSPELGQVMVRQRSRLDNEETSRSFAHLEGDITSARLRQLELEDQRIAESAWRIPVGTGLRASATQVVNRLQTQRAELLDQGIAAYRRYAAEMMSIRGHELALVNQTEDYRTLLNQRLFWIPSAERFGGESWIAMFLELRWLARQLQRFEFTDTVGSFLQRSPIKAVLSLTFLCLLIGIRGSVWQRFSELRSRLDNVETDAMWYTWLGIGSTLLTAAPLPMVLAVVSFILHDTQGIGQALSIGFADAALVLGVLLVLIQLYRPLGIAHTHFKWSKQTLAALQRYLPPLAAVLAPCAVLMALANLTSDKLGTESLSRVAFALSTSALGVFCFPIARAVLHGALTNPLAPKNWRVLAQTAALAIPTSLLVLSMVGYHFTAQLLAHRLVITTGVVVFGIISFYIAARAVSLIEARLRHSEQRDRHASLRRQHSTRLAAGSAGEGVPDTLESQKVDAKTLGSQTRSLIRLGISVGVCLVIWTFWSDLLPALHVVNDISLWRSADEQAVTPANLIVALMVAVLCTLGYRNVPGALEVSLLSRLNLEPGASFAITTVTKHLIAFTGIWQIMSLLGARWSELQWLVAALGIGLGFGLQEIVANFVSGIVILFERPIRVGDTVTVGTQTGTVSRIRIRSTTITDWDRKEQIIPNKTFMNEQLTNWTLSDPIVRLVVKVTVAHGSDVPAVHQILLRLAQANARAISEPSPAVFFVGFGDHGLNFEMRVFIKNMLDRMPLIHELHLAIESEFRKHGIKIPLPHRDIRVLSESPENQPEPTQDEPLLILPELGGAPLIRSL